MRLLLPVLVLAGLLGCAPTCVGAPPDQHSEAELPAEDVQQEAPERDLQSGRKSLPGEPQPEADGQPAGRDGPQEEVHAEMPGEGADPESRGEEIPSEGPDTGAASEGSLDEPRAEADGEPAARNHPPEEQLAQNGGGAREQPPEETESAADGEGAEPDWDLAEEAAAEPGGDYPPEPSLPGQEETAAEDSACHRFQFPEFPWPPPKPVQQYTLTARDLPDLSASPSFGEIDRAIRAALAREQYEDLRYFQIRDEAGCFVGIARVTGLQPYGSGAKRVGTKTYSLEGTQEGFLARLLRWLKNAAVPAGDYRLFVIAVGLPVVGYAEEGELPDMRDAPQGHLPPTAAAIECEDPCEVTLLVYTLHKAEHREGKLFASEFPCSVHLRKAGILQALGVGYP